MKDLSVVIVGGGSGLGALLAQMAVEAGAGAIGIIDINRDAAEAALKPARDRGLPTAVATADIQNGPEAHAAFAEIAAAFPGVPASLKNSSAHFLPDCPSYQLTRPGYALYGGNPTPGRPNPMQPVVGLEARILQVREAKAGGQGQAPPGRYAQGMQAKKERPRRRPGQEGGQGPGHARAGGRLPRA